MLIGRRICGLALILPALFVFGCTGSKEVEPPKRNLPRVDLPSLGLNRVDNLLELIWADSVSIRADRECRIVIPLNFAGQAEILTAGFYIRDDRGVIQSGSGSYDPNRSPAAELIIDLGVIPAGSYSYELTFLSGPEGLEVTKKTGTIVVR